MYVTEPQLKFPVLKSVRLQRLDESELIRRLTVRDQHYKLLKHQNRAWLKRHGKKDCVGFPAELRQALKEFFGALDVDSSGAVSIEELYEPLLALGLVETRDQVQALFHKVDSDSSGVIEFTEFVQVLEEGSHRTNSALSEMVRRLVDQPEALPFKLRISNARRRMMLTAYGPEEAQAKGQMVLKAFQTELELGRGEKSKGERLVEKKRMELQRHRVRRGAQGSLPGSGETTLRRPTHTRHNLSSIV